MHDVMTGPAGKAERFPQVVPQTAAQQATLAGWLIDAPGQSPAWRHYLLSVIHLRDIPGAPPAKIRRPGATHEILLCALDPEAQPRISDIETLHPLRPLNAEVQFTATDELAVHMGELAAEAIVSGRMAAEPAFPMMGYREWQIVIDTTLEHHRTGVHPECCKPEPPL